MVLLFFSVSGLTADSGDKINIFGYFSVNIENVFKAPTGVDGSGNTTYEDTPMEYSFPHFDLMFLSMPMSNPTVPV